ncbi:MAG: ribonuclease HII [Oscillospiraceae bacterium]|nr:ribonuclease HII [Oscillospiraceae bacterium]
MTLFEYDAAIRESVDAIHLCGVDEAGRGPLAGPVYAAAVILPPEISLEGLNDSKKLTEKKREQLFEEIKYVALAWCIASASVQEIEELNILQAALLAMKRAVKGLNLPPDFVLVDGDKLPTIETTASVLPKGDMTSACIAAASILAKVERDRQMLALAEEYPAYSFEKHKGYGTKLHYQMLDEHGPCPAHRSCFLEKWSRQCGKLI